MDFTSSKSKTHIIATQYQYIQLIRVILHLQYNITDDLVSKVQPVATVGALFSRVNNVTLTLPKTHGYAFRLCVLYAALIVSRLNTLEAQHKYET